MSARILVVLGTRPEAIKLAPVVEELRAARHRVELLATGQHREMLEQALACFGLAADHDLRVMAPDQGLSELAARVLRGVDGVLRDAAPELVVVQGDTTTTFATALAAFHRRVPVAHVEAGLRSFDRTQPFPEEINRRLATVLADLHLAPTRLARERLEAEGVPRERIAVTGNTVVDALLRVLASAPEPEWLARVVPPDARLLLATTHRRESWGRELEGVCDALARLVDRYEDLHVVLPVHLNPNVSRTVRERLGDRDRVHLHPPVDYPTFARLLARATLVVTDSGGVQEEAPTLGKPLLLLRRVTERPEAFEAGAARLVGTDPERIVAEAARLLDDPAAYRAMTNIPNPYGDGRAAGRIVQAVERFLRGERPLLGEEMEFGEEGQ